MEPNHLFRAEVEVPVAVEMDAVEPELAGRLWGELETLEVRVLELKLVVVVVVLGALGALLALVMAEQGNNGQ